MAVEGALRRSGGPGGEDDHRRIVRSRRCGGDVVRRLAQQRREIEEIGPFRFDRDDGIEVGQRFVHHGERGEPGSVRHHHAGARGAQPVGERVRPEAQSERNGNGTEPIDREMRDRRLEALRQDDGDPVARTDAVPRERAGETTRAGGEFAEGQRRGGRLAAILDQADPVRVLACPPVGAGLGDVEARRKVPAEAAIEVVVGGGRHKRPARRLGSEVVPPVGIEPTILAERDFESRASTNSATGATAGAAPRGTIAARAPPVNRDAPQERRRGRRRGEARRHLRSGRLRPMR